MLHEIGGPGQQRLRAARVLVVGAGGLGSPALLYLAAAGVGTLGVVDDDAVGLSNLQRQVLHGTADDRRAQGRERGAGARPAQPARRGRAARAAARRRAAPPRSSPRYDLVLDGCDNFATRYLVNAACVAAGRPLISAAMSQWEGQIALFHPAGGGPCYECLFPEPPAPGAGRRAAPRPGSSGRCPGSWAR